MKKYVLLTTSLGLLNGLVFFLASWLCTGASKAVDSTVFGAMIAVFAWCLSVPTALLGPGSTRKTWLTMLIFTASLTAIVTSLRWAWPAAMPNRLGDIRYILLGSAGMGLLIWGTVRLVQSRQDRRLIAQYDRRRSS